MLDATQGFLATGGGLGWGLAIGALLPFVTIGHLSTATSEAYQRRVSTRIGFGALIIHYMALAFWSTVTALTFHTQLHVGVFYLIVIPPVMSYGMMLGYRATHARALSFFPPIVEPPESSE